ncbi:hypothetical protein [Desulfobulbus propionicus]
MLNFFEIKEDVIIFRINKLFHRVVTQEQMYEASRGIWRIGIRRNKANFAFAVFDGEIKEVYKIIAWYPAGTLKYKTRIIDFPPVDNPLTKRWEFEGVVAGEEIRNKYLNKSVKQYIPRGASNPVIYVNCL